MSNSPLVSYTCLSPNRTSPRKHKIDTVTIHCMAGDLTVEECGQLFSDPKQEASSNYGIGSDGRIALYVDEGDRSWCSSDRDNDNRAVTIEVANTKAAHPWPVSEAAYKSLIDLLVDICRRNDIEELRWEGDRSLIGQTGRQNMTVHRWFAAKACPGDFLYNLHGQIAAEVNARLKEDNPMSFEQFKEFWARLRAELQDNDKGSWSEEAREWAVQNGLIAGNGTEINGEPNYMWQDMVTREQFVTVLFRFAQLMGKA